MIRSGALFVLLLIIPAHAQTVAVPPGFDPHLIANVYATALAFMAPRTLEPVAVSQPLQRPAQVDGAAIVEGRRRR